MNPLQIIKAHNDLDEAMSRVDGLGDMSELDACLALDDLIQKAHSLKLVLVPAGAQTSQVPAALMREATTSPIQTPEASGLEALAAAFADKPAASTPAAPAAPARYTGPLPEFGRLVGYLGGNQVKVIDPETKVKMYSESMLHTAMSQDHQIDEIRLVPLESDEIILSSADMVTS